MSYPAIVARLTPEHAATLASVKSNAERLLNHTPRFRFFTLHGTAHLNNLFRIFEFLLAGGVELSEQEIYLLSLAICIHDLGMVCTLRESQISEVLDGPTDFADPPALEDFIRETHHNLVENYLEDNAAFLASAGVSVNEIGHVREISRCHRKVILQRQSGFIKHLGALLRIIDELDISDERAPSDVLRNNYKDMDATSCWHWFKHNITERWQLGHTMFYTSENGKKTISFRIGVLPPAERTVRYWSTQTLSPIVRVLRDEGTEAIIRERFGIDITAEVDERLCKVNRLDETWQSIEDRALSSSQPVILVVDDEFSKYRDLYLPLSERYNIMSAEDEVMAAFRIADGLGIAVDPKYQIREPRDYDLIDVLNAAVEHHRSEADERRNSIKLNLSIRSVPLYGDRKAIEVALGHLLMNAIKYSYDDSYVSITAQHDPKSVSLIIKNTGLPLPEGDERGKIWEFGFRGQGAKEQHVNGSGIGLFTVRKILYAHGGHVAASSDPQDPTVSRFTMTLPTNTFAAKLTLRIGERIRVRS